MLLEGTSFHSSFVLLVSIKDVKENSAIRLSDNQLCLRSGTSRRSDADAESSFSKDNVDDQRQYDKTFAMLIQMFGIKTVDVGGGPRKTEERARLEIIRGKSQVFRRDLY